MLSSVKKLSTARRDEIIQAACEKNAGLEIVVERDGRPAKYSSRFLLAVPKENDMRLVVEQGSEEGHMMKYRENEEIEAVFHVGGERFAFDSRVIGRCVFPLNNQQKVPAFVLRYPEDLESRQRRAHYRVPLGVADQVTMAFLELGGREVLAETCRIYTGVISDISAGGLAVLTRQRLPASMAAGAHVAMSFQIPGEPEHINLGGIVRNVRRNEDGSSRLLGVEYVRADGDVQTRQQIDLIQRFVVRRQREILKKLRML